MNDYEALKAYGFSPAKAGEILLDMQRGDIYAKVALAAATSHRANPDAAIDKATGGNQS